MYIFNHNRETRGYFLNHNCAVLRINILAGEKSFSQQTIRGNLERSARDPRSLLAGRSLAGRFAATG